jgi:membrane protease YdiL (CAAX protease family)
MWDLGKAYLEIGWNSSRERPSVFTILGIVIGSALLFLASLIVCSLLFRGFIPEQIKGGLYTKGSGLYRVLPIFLSVALGFLPVLMHLRRKLNCSFTDAFLGKNRLNLPWFLGTVAVTWATYALVEMSFDHGFRWAFPSADQVILIPFLLVAILFQSMAEELFFRGYFSKALYFFGRSIVPVFVVSPVLFALYHQQFNPVMLLYYGGVGVFYSYVSLRTGGLQISTALHFSNNSFAVLAGSLVNPASLSNPQLLQVGLVRAVQIVVTALLLEAALRFWGMRERVSDNSIPPAICDLRSR